MIERITGTVVFRDSNHLIVDVSGVGYGVDTTISTANQLALNHSAMLWIYTQVREDDIKLFGFATIEERILFTHLLSAPGVGAKLAMSMLSVLGGHGIVASVFSDDSERLKEVPGIAAKAKEIQLHLKRRLGKIEDNAWLNRLKTSSQAQEQLFGLDLSSANSKSKSLSQELLFDLQSALSNLGYREREVQGVLKVLPQNTGELSFQALLRQAIGILSNPEKRSQMSASNSAKPHGSIDEVF